MSSKKSFNNKSLRKLGDYEIFDRILDVSMIGNTYQAVNTTNQDFVLVQIFDIELIKRHLNSNEKDFISQIKKMQEINNPLSLSLIETITENNKIYLFYDQGDGDCLQNYLDAKGALKEDEALNIMVDVLLSYAGYASKNVLHRNITAHYFYKSGKIYKILNYFYSPLFKQRSLSTNYFRFNIPPPETLGSWFLKPLSNKTDVWSMGTLFYELLFGVLPWNCVTKDDLESNIEKTFKKKKDQKGDIWSTLSNPKQIKISDRLKSLIEKMLCYDEEERISYENIIKDQYLVEKKHEILKKLMDYQKKTEIDLNNDKFKSISSEKRMSILKSFNLCKNDPLKFMEYNILENFEFLENDYGNWAGLLKKIVLLELGSNASPVRLRKTTSLNVDNKNDKLFQKRQSDYAKNLEGSGNAFSSMGIDDYNNVFTDTYDSRN